MSTTINSVHEHAHTKKQVPFTFTWSYDGTTIDWTGAISLAHGKSHTLGGGKIVNVPPDAVEQAVSKEIAILIDDTDIESLDVD